MGLAQRITAAPEYFPCDLLFIHRDAEAEPLVARLEAIKKAMARTKHRHVLIVPIRI